MDSIIHELLLARAFRFYCSLLPTLNSSRLHWRSITAHILAIKKGREKESQRWVVMGGTSCRVGQQFAQSRATRRAGFRCVNLLRMFFSFSMLPLVHSTTVLSCWCCCCLCCYRLGALFVYCVVVFLCVTRRYANWNGARRRFFFLLLFLTCVWLLFFFDRWWHLRYVFRVAVLLTSQVSVWNALLHISRQSIGWQHRDSTGLVDDDTHFNIWSRFMLNKACAKFISPNSVNCKLINCWLIGRTSLATADLLPCVVG